MDILAARKKAAQRARQQKNREEQAPAPQPPVVPQEGPAVTAPEAPAAAAQSRPAVAAAVAESPVAAEAPPEPVSEIPAAEQHVEEIELLSLRLGDEEYAVNVEDVKEVLKNRELTLVPNAPDYIQGVTALRGQVLPVVDLCKRLGIPAGTRDEKSRILVMNVHDEEAGIVVDRVTGVLRISPDAVRPVPETIERGAEFLRGIARKGERLYILLDIEKTLGG
jgi:purine-binding chemotaxis protein CheW